MKPIPLRTCVQRHPRLARAPGLSATRRWRPLSLRWPRRVTHAALSAASPRLRPMPQPHHTSLHLHFAPPVVRVPTARSSPCPRPATAQPRAPRQTRSQPRQPMLRHTHLHSTVMRRELTNSSTLRRNHVLSANVSNNVLLPIHHTTSTISAGAPTLRPATSELAGRAPRPAHRPATRPSAPLTSAPAPRRESRVADSLARVLAPTTALVWRKATPSEPVSTDAVAGATTMPAGSTALPAMQVAPPAIPASLPQHVREAVRVNLLDPAVADRLADDVIRRVEKRMRVERERRGH